MSWMDQIIMAKGGSGGGGGGGASVLVITVDISTGTLDKTWKEIHDAYISGGAVVHVEYSQGTPGEATNYDTYASVSQVQIVEDEMLGTTEYWVMDFSNNSFVAYTETGYPGPAGGGGGDGV